MSAGFIIAAGILALAAVGLNGAVNFYKVKFTKDPVPLVRNLDTVPGQLGDWVQVSKDEPLDKDVQDALATNLYIFRDYVNTKLVSKADIDAFDKKTGHERKQLLAQLQATHPDAVINMAVTYYTGLVDTVAHIPERCYIADGYQPSDTPETVAWDTASPRLGNDPKDPNTVHARYLEFQDQTAAGRVTKRVGYFFFTNGHYESDPIGVRQTLQNLRYKHGFYSKVELMSIYNDHDGSSKMMESFLASAMPEIEKCYPDWDAVENGKTH